MLSLLHHTSTATKSLLLLSEACVAKGGIPTAASPVGIALGGGKVAHRSSHAAAIHGTLPVGRGHVQPAVAEGGDVGVLVSVSELGEGGVLHPVAAVGIVRMRLAEGLVRALEGRGERLAHLSTLVVGPVATVCAGLLDLVVPRYRSILAGLAEGGEGGPGGVVLGLGGLGIDLPRHNVLQPLGRGRCLASLQRATTLTAEAEGRAEGGQALARTLRRCLAGRGVLYGSGAGHGLEDYEAGLLDHGGD